MSADRLVHIPGLGDFQVDKITAAPEPLKLSGGRKDEEMFEVRNLNLEQEKLFFFLCRPEIWTSRLVRDRSWMLRIFLVSLISAVMRVVEGGR